MLALKGISRNFRTIQAVGTYALLLALNEYLHTFSLLSLKNGVTLVIAMGFFLATDDAPWNLLMATAPVYVIPSSVLCHAVRRYMITGLTTGRGKV